MDELMDMMVDDASASQISDQMKDILFAKSAERVDAYRSTTANALLYCAAVIGLLPLNKNIKASKPL